MLTTSKVFRNWKEKGRISLLSPMRNNSISSAKSHLLNAPFWKHCAGFMSNTCASRHNPANITIASILVDCRIWPFFAVLSGLTGSFKSIVTQASLGEAEITDEVLHQIVRSIETADASNSEVCNGIEKLCKSGGGSAMAKLVQIARDKCVFLGADAYDILLAAASEKGDIELSVEIFKNLLISVMLPSSKSYINLAKAFMNTDECALLLNVVDEISELDSHRCVLILNRIIYAFGDCRQIEKALIVFDHMKNLKCKPDLVTYNTVLGILGRFGKMVEMLREFAYMKEAKITPDIVSYNTLLNTLQKFGRLDLCLVYMREMDENRLLPDLRTYAALIESFGRSGNVEEALRLFNAMKYRQVKPSIYIYRSLINNLKKMGKLDIAASLWDEMNSSLSKLVGPMDFKKKQR
ncbi:hypothetical protein Cgig2_017052 [Carnegiea gigantea]|uniref:Pentatricopeptide repeat-containing protein n=1 Tax=Carnegiea gigantea TaxID=171969 RepID=A0A9Q1Q8Y9_9CARY|nr:hypothetical protein Cgig2_017052 [Carnegiea gigantea]